MSNDDQMKVDADGDEMELVQDIQSNDPSNWFQDTEPFTAVRWMVREDVSDDDISKRLATNEIKTLKDLSAQGWCVIDLIEKVKFADFFAAIQAAKDRIRFTVEQVLGGQVEYEDECIPQEAFQLFAPEAVSVFPDNETALKEGVRVKKFNLVLGSSGSGKTLFALKSLPTLLFGEGKAHFSVHFTVDSAMFYFDKQGEDIQRSFHEAVTRTVKEIVSARIMKAKLLNVKEIDLFLHVVIDEAGNEDFKVYFDTSAKINKLVQVIQNTMAPTFSKGVYVTVVGTGLEAITAKITSMVQAVKFRMQPWALQSFKALVEKSPYSFGKQALIVKTVHDYPMLEHLVSNGRCAYFVFKSLAAVKVLAPNRVAEIVNGLIRSVSDSYAKSNGLSVLTKSNERFAVVRSVFRELDRSTEHKKDAFLPEFEDLRVGGLERFRSVAICFLETNVEMKKGVLGFVRGEEFSLSVSPALVIVMFHLLNIEGEVTWDWNGFESIAMLSELKQMVVNTIGIPSHLNSLVLRLPSPFPGTNAYISCSVPMTNTSTVILNGPRAHYADVIAPFKLVQAKHSTDDSNTIRLNLKSELDKMGLTNSVGKKHRLSQAVTDTLYEMWMANQDIPEPQVEVSKSEKRTHRHACYPVDALCGRFIKKEIATVVVTVKGASVKAPAAHSLIWDGRTSFLAEHPVMAVFVTNCQKFELTVIDKTRVIGPDDVNWKGELLILLDADLLNAMGVRENVLLRFLFFANRF